VGKIEPLQKIIAEMSKTGDNPAMARSELKAKTYYRHAIIIAWQESKPENRGATVMSGI
jgi:hypothetical protein